MTSSSQNPLIKLEDLRAYSQKCTPSQVIATWTTFVGLNINTYRQDIEIVRKEGTAALARSLPIALRDTGQSGVVAKFLLGLYNGSRFPFDMTELRRLDHELLLDCVSVLSMDCYREKEVHEYFENGQDTFEQMADDRGLNAAK
ncbi:MAG: hypothetical protein V4858_06335 [Pseudomonadota bacterium]